LPLARLRPDPKNPRAHGDKQVRQIANSIEAFGFNVPILIDRHMQVIAGHGRVLASKLLGLTEVPTICLEHLTEAQRRAFMIADNRLTENSTWDARLLGEQLKILSEAELDFSLEITGFEMAEIDLYIDGLESVDDDDAADALPEPWNGTTVSRPGDVWLLGKHRLLRGDALSPELHFADAGQGGCCGLHRPSV
jgi:ParB-like chromosome segregation protein Spo0J